MKTRMFLCAIAVAAACGCTSGPDGIYIDETVWVYATNRIDRAVERHSSAPGGEVRVGEGRAQEEREGSRMTSSDDRTEPPGADSLALDFRYGGFKGGGAKEDSRCRIGSFRMSLDGMSYKWVSGGCEALGATSREDYDHTVACAFYWDGNKWVGGKFDWVSTSRTYRDFENIRTGYGGWDAVAFFRATKHAFCIVSADGKKRSNLIED